MAKYVGKYLKESPPAKWHCPYLLVPLFFILTEIFAFQYLMPVTESDRNLWPMAFGLLWGVIFGAALRLVPSSISRVGFVLMAVVSLVYAVGQTGYYLLFSEMMWLSDFRYASEGADYLEVLTGYPGGWFVWVVGLLLLVVVIILKYPAYRVRIPSTVFALLLAAGAVISALWLPQAVFLEDKDVRYSGSDYGRSKSSQAAYENMFSAHRLYQVCGLYQTMAKDIHANAIYPMTPQYAQEQKRSLTEIDGYFQEKGSSGTPNEMTGILKDKNIVLVLMESMDDWMIGEHTPTIEKLMSEGIRFTNFYTPPYGGIRTFNTEFCINTGSFLYSQGGLAFDYVTNSYNHSLANLLKQEGYSAKLFHYNDPEFYSRNVYSQALGYEEYVCYGDYVEETDQKKKKQILYDDLLLFTNPGLRQEFFRDSEKTFNFVITRSAHLSYKYNEVLSHWALKKYPEYKGMTGSEEMDCAYVKARLVDDLFARLLQELEKEGTLENTVIIGITDHYTYGYKNTAELMELSNVEHSLLLEKTPCFIWSSELDHQTVEKPMNTADFLPTLLNLMEINSEYAYLGNDAFDPDYNGFVPFSNGSWITASGGYDASSGKMIMIHKSGMDVHAKEQLDHRARAFTRINNLILKSDYYQ